MTSPRSLVLASIGVLLLAAAVPAAEAGGRRSASPRGAGGASVSRSAPAHSGASARPHAAPPAAARGRATYGYGRHGGYAPYPPGGWYGWSDAYWGWGGWWYPSYYGPYWGWPYWNATVVVPGGIVPGIPGNAPGTITTSVTPKNASLLVDGEDLGRAKDYNGTWDSLRLAPGVHVFEFSRDGYQTFRAVVDVQPGRSYRIERDLHKGGGVDPESDPLPAPESAPASVRGGSPSDRATEVVQDALVVGFLDLTVRPADAVVYLDGEFFARGEELDRLHGAIPVAAGPHRLEVVRPGHVPRTMLVEVVAGGAPTTLEIALESER